jgi:hypothetical protein
LVDFLQAGRLLVAAREMDKMGAKDVGAMEEERRELFVPVIFDLRGSQVHISWRDEVKCGI